MLTMVCHKTSSNEAMKPSRPQEHLTKIHAENKDENISYFKALEGNF